MTNYTYTYTDNTSTSTSIPLYYTSSNITVPQMNLATANLNGFYEIDPKAIAITEPVTQKDKKELSPIEKKIKEQKEINRKECGFVDIKEYVPNKVYEFSIFNGYSRAEKVKTVCDEEDEFNLETAFFLALAKKLYADFTPEGHLHKAKELAYSKYHTKKVKHGIKLFKLLKEKEEYDKLQEDLRKQQHEKYIAKKKRQKEKKKHDATLELYKTIKDAIEDAR